MIFRHLAAALAIASSMGSANAQLQERDLNQDGVIDAFYDTQQNISWIADANYAATSGYNMHPGYVPYGIDIAPGSGSWREAASWAHQLEFMGIGDWRLPQLTLSNPQQFSGCPIPLCVGFFPMETELTRLYAGVGGDFGMFRNVQGLYWSEEYQEPNGQYFSQYMSPSSGAHGGTDELYGVGSYGAAWAVHDGDVGALVAPIPEPSTYALMLVGLAAVAFGARRREKKRR